MTWYDCLGSTHVGSNDCTCKKHSGLPKKSNTVYTIILFGRRGKVWRFSISILYTAVSVKSCPTKLWKGTQQCRLALWVVRVSLCFIEFQGDSATRKEKAWINALALFPSTTLKHLEAHSSNLKTTITHKNFRHCRLSFCLFVRQPYSKQLY